MGAIINTISKMVAYFKFSKPKTITYCSFPQTIKSASVTVTKDEKNPKLFNGSDGAQYVAQEVVCKKYVTFSDGQKFRNGDIAYFKIEPVVWEVGGCYFSQERDKKNRLQFVKTNENHFVSKFVLAKKSTTMSRLLISVAEEEKYGKRGIYTISTVAGLDKFYVGRKYEPANSPRRNRVRKATDYAIACGVSVNGRSAYHTLMDTNQMCCSPNGKLICVKKNIVCGEVISFHALLDDMSKQD